MITFKTLENTDSEIIRQAINLGFSDYSIPLQFSPEHWEQKVLAENIKWHLSVGAFDGDTLVGVIMHGEKKTNVGHWIYNGGTAVIPSHRGQKNTKKMYDFILPKLKGTTADKLILEVIEDNFPAITSYKASGFKTKRHLESYKGLLSDVVTSEVYEVKPLPTFDWALLQSFWDVKPTWQNDIEAVELSQMYLKSLGVFSENRLLGYIIYNPKTNRILQLAVSKLHRRQKIASTLLSKAIEHKETPLVVTNIDNAKHDTIAFMKALGIPNFVNLFEMELPINRTHIL